MLPTTGVSLSYSPRLFHSLSLPCWFERELGGFSVTGDRQNQASPAHRPHNQIKTNGQRNCSVFHALLFLA